jgi:hypothetical protein
VADAGEIGLGHGRFSGVSPAAEQADLLNRKPAAAGTAAGDNGRGGYYCLGGMAAPATELRGSSGRPVNRHSITRTRGSDSHRASVAA